MTEVGQVSEDMTQFIMALTAALWMEHLGPQMTGEVCAKVADAPSAFDVWIPFLVEIPREEPAGADDPPSPVATAGEPLSVARAALARSQAHIS